MWKDPQRIVKRLQFQNCFLSVADASFMSRRCLYPLLNWPNTVQEDSFKEMQSDSSQAEAKLSSKDG